jgi:hypothetical protein
MQMKKALLSAFFYCSYLFYIASIIYQGVNHGS